MTPAASSPATPVKSIGMAYALLILAGFVGAHRFYVEKWFSALGYVLVFFATLILLGELTLLIMIGLALVADAILLPRLTRQANERIATNLEKDPDYYRHRADGEIAPWALVEKTGFWDALSAPARIASFILLPMLFTALMLMMDMYELVVFPVIILLATGLVTSLDEIARRHPTMLQLPGVEPALEHVRQMKAYYWEHEPSLRTPFLRVFTRARTEFKPYWKIVGLMMLAILLDLVWSFEENYTPYINFGDAAFIIIFQIVVCGYAVLIFLSQLSALSFHYSLAGKRIRLRFLTVAALAVTGASFGLGIWFSNMPGWVPFLSEVRLEERMKDEEFQHAVVDYSSMFIMYYRPEEPDPEEMPLKPEQKRICNDPISMNSCMHTEWLRELLGGIAPNDENNAFQVFDAKLEQDDQPTAWRGVRYLTVDKAPVVIAAYNESEDILCGNFDKSDEDYSDYCAGIFKTFSKLPVE